MQLDEFQKSGNWIKKCTKILLNPDNKNPFPKPPIAANFYNNPPLFCFGRDEQIEELSDEIKDSINSFEPKLIRVIGKQGIGKSTLICWGVKQLSKDYSLPIIYLETSGQPEDFKLKSLYRQIVSNIEKIDIINRLLLNSIQKFIKVFRDAGGKLYETLSNKFSGEQINKLITRTEFISSQIKEPLFNQKIFEMVNNNAMLIKDFIPVDLNFLLIFWKAHVQNPEYFDSLNAFKGEDSYKGYNVQTDSDASKYIDEFIELIRWSLDENTTMVLIFDHLEAGTSHLKQMVFSNLFSLLLNLRQKKYITIILSGTLDAYNEFDEVLEEDQGLQLDNWSKTLALTNLESDSVKQIISKYSTLFWSQFNDQPHPENILFPFGINSVKYLYENNGLDLRKTLKNLYELIEKYRKNQKIERVDTFYKAFKAFRLRGDMALSYIEQKEFTKIILDSKIQDKTRSTIVENALCKFFKILMKHPDYDYLTDVKHEPPLGKSKKKPDVFLEFFGNESLDQIKKVGIEVKMYRKGKEISKNDIKKTYVLLEEKAVDYVIWTSNVPLDIKYKYDLPEELHPNLGRTGPLNDLELAYISFMVHFDEIFGSDPTVEQAEFLLNRIKLSPIVLKEKLKGLIKLTEIPEILKPKPGIDITSYSSTVSEETSTKTKKVKEKVKKLTITSIEIGLEQIKEKIKKYIDEKLKSVTRITSANTIKAVKKSLHLAENDKKWDEDIWTNAIDIGKKAGFRTTTKTIFFK